jgi:hypothetical protein
MLAAPVAFGASTAGAHEPTAQHLKVNISGEDCARLVEHRPRADVEFKPGVDVRGRPVAPADLPGSRMKYKLPKTIEFDIEFNPLKGETRTRFGETTVTVGRVKYDIGKRTFTFNGEPLSDPALADLARKCREILEK